MEKIKLNNGVEMPIIGYGVYQVDPSGKSVFFDHHAPDVVKMFMGWR